MPRRTFRNQRKSAGLGGPAEAADAEVARGSALRAVGAGCAGPAAAVAGGGAGVVIDRVVARIVVAAVGISGRIVDVVAVVVIFNIIICRIILVVAVVTASSIVPILPKIDFAIIGEPTLMKMAIAERGLIVFDIKIKGTSSHAAHINDDNPIIKSIEVLKWIKNLKFEKKSKFLGNVKATVTQIQSGNQHNVVPSELKIVLDVRVNDCYTNQEIYEILKTDSPCEIIPRSLNLNSSSISTNHAIVLAANELGIQKYGSPTLSDQSKISFPSIKIGPGDSLRSHSADEYIYIDEIKNAIPLYIQLLNKII